MKCPLFVVLPTIAGHRGAGLPPTTAHTTGCPVLVAQTPALRCGSASALTDFHGSEIIEGRNEIGQPISFS
jgi:hypothetical protein